MSFSLRNNKIHACNLLLSTLRKVTIPALFHSHEMYTRNVCFHVSEILMFMCFFIYISNKETCCFMRVPG